MCCASRRTGSRPSTKSTSATSRKPPQPASSSACLSGPGPSTSRSIAWRSRRTDLGRQQLAGAERIGVRENRGQSHLPRHIHRRQDSGAVQLPRVALGLLLKFGHPATRRWGPHPTVETRPTPPLNGFSNGLLSSKIFVTNRVAILPSGKTAV